MGFHLRAFQWREHFWWTRDLERNWLMLLSTTLRMVCCSDLVSVLAFDQTVSLLGALSLHVFALMECFLCSLPTIGVVSNMVEYVQNCPNAHGTAVLSVCGSVWCIWCWFVKGCNRYSEGGVWCGGGWYQWCNSVVGCCLCEGWMPMQLIDAYLGLFGSVLSSVFG